MVATQKEFTQGNLEVTDQGLDMAINGRGFFQILMPDGSVNYTRDGRFQIDSTGQVVTAGGFPLEPAITVPLPSAPTVWSRLLMRRPDRPLKSAVSS